MRPVSPSRQPASKLTIPSALAMGARLPIARREGGDDAAGRGVADCRGFARVAGTRYPQARHRAPCLGDGAPRPRTRGRASRGGGVAVAGGPGAGPRRALRADLVCAAGGNSARGCPATAYESLRRGAGRPPGRIGPRPVRRLAPRAPGHPLPAPEWAIRHRHHVSWPFRLSASATRLANRRGGGHRAPGTPARCPHGPPAPGMRSRPQGCAAGAPGAAGPG